MKSLWMWLERLEQRNGAEVVEVTEKQPKRARMAGLAGLALAGFIALSPSGGALARDVSDVSPARGHAQVVAQSVIQVDGPVRWQVDRSETGERGEIEQLSGPGFLIGADGVVLITDVATGGIQRLAVGEAAAVREGADYERVALGDGEAALYELGLISEEDGADGALFQGDEIAELDGLRDVDLLRDALKPNEKATLAGGDAPTLLLVTDGEIAVTLAGEDEPIVLKAGEAAEFAGELELQADKAGRASYLAAVIGPEVRGEADNATPRAGAEDGDDAGSGGQSGSQPAPDVTVVPDSDNDGLNDNLEAQIGTDPQNPDSDQDGLLDGDEYYDYGSDPLSMDGDGDMLPDYNEIMQQGTDPMNPDTDGDSLNDHDELNYATDPLNPDSDGDGLFDGVELFTYPSDPLDTDTDDDGLSDGDEVNLYGSHPNAMDTDGEGLPDYNEVIQHGTNPANPDSDADGINDHDELAYGTSLTDADSDGDGVLDGAEIFGGSDPLDPNSVP